MPIFGLGTWMLKGQEGNNAVSWAIEEGYRLIDTATFYGNEREIGKAVVNSQIPREELFITSKVWNSDQGYEKTLNAFEKSLKRLNMSYLDLYLIHWPVSGLRIETWKALERIYQEGRARAIGISNFTIRHIQELLENATITPMVNQVEFSPFLYQKDLLEYCQSKEVRLEAYAPLTRGTQFKNPLLKTISLKHNKTVAQILIRWGLEHDIIEIPKSSDKQHLKENANVFDFELDSIDMKQLDGLNKNLRLVDDPNQYI
ncbi:MAG: aldo/keto reductase [Promethearchaeota archaeon]|nr:MAG: aldo/keto reductase [Candidatus Lokiarchaeota archaeon]